MMAIHIAQKRTITFLSIVIGAIVAVAVILGVMGLL